MGKNKLFSLWKKKGKSGIFSLFLRFLSFLYLWLYVIRKALFRLKLINARKLKAKVISVGNITLGGSGKTPFVLYLAKKLKEKGTNFAILTRGYGRRIKTTRELKKLDSSDVNWQEVGDEPFLLSSHLQQVPVIIDKDRYRAGEIALTRYRAKLLILDDGFQHWRLKRDIDILMVDSTTQLKKERLFPAGRLREPLSSFKRAQIFVLTRVNQSKYVDEIKKMLRHFNHQTPIVESILEVTSVVNWKDKTKIDLNFLRGKRGVAFCGIGNPLSFDRTLKDLGIEILNAFFFLDHYIYNQKDLLSLEEDAKKVGADFLFTTEKDSIRLPKINNLEIPILVVNIELKIISGEEKLWEVLNL